MMIRYVSVTFTQALIFWSDELAQTQSHRKLPFKINLSRKYVHIYMKKFIKKLCKEINEWRDDDDISYLRKLLLPKGILVSFLLQMQSIVYLVCLFGLPVSEMYHSPRITLFSCFNRVFFSERITLISKRSNWIYDNRFSSVQLILKAIHFHNSIIIIIIIEGMEVGTILTFYNICRYDVYVWNII